MQTNLSWMVGVTIVYCLAMILLSYYVGKKMTRDEKEFMLGGREFNSFLTAIGNTSILISGGYLPGIVMYGYLFGIGGMWFYIGWGTGALVALLCWAVFWRLTGAFTPTEWFEYRYGKTGRIAITLVILIASLAIIGWQYVGSGGVIAGALHIPKWLGIAIVGLVVTFYVMLGGVWAATLTDLIQWSWVVISTFLILPLYLFFKFGPPDLSKLPANFMSFPFGTLPVIKFVLPSALTFLLLHQSLLNQAPYWTRAAGTRNKREVTIGWTWTVIITYTLGIIGAIIGVYVRMYVPDLKDPSLALGNALNLIPIPLAAVVMAGLMAATMSTCDIYLVAGINQLIRDVAQYLLKIEESKRLLTWAKWGTVIYGTAAVLFAILWPRGLNLLFGFGTAIGAPMFIFYLDSWLLKVGNGPGAIAAVVAALSTVLYWELLTDNYKRIHTLWLVFTITLITLVVVSLLTRKYTTKIAKEESRDEYLKNSILVALRKGYRTAADIGDMISQVGTKGADIQRSQILKEIDRMISDGLVERESERLTRQLFFRLTSKGQQEADRLLDSANLESLTKYGIDREALQVLELIVKQPGIKIDNLVQQLRQPALKILTIAEHLATRGLVQVKGIIRCSMSPTEQGIELFKLALQERPN